MTKENKDFNWNILFIYLYLPYFFPEFKALNHDVFKYKDSGMVDNGENHHQITNDVEANK